MHKKDYCKPCLNTPFISIPISVPTSFKVIKMGYEFGVVLNFTHEMVAIHQMKGPCLTLSYGYHQMHKEKGLYA